MPIRRLPTFLLLVLAVLLPAALRAQDICTSRTDCVQQGFGMFGIPDSRPVHQRAGSGHAYDGTFEGDGPAPDEVR